MYSLSIIYTWTATGETMVVTGKQLEGAGFPGYDTAEDAMRAVTQWINRSAGRAVIQTILID